MMMKLSSTILIILLGCAAFSSWAQEQTQQEAIQQALKFYLSKVRSSPQNLALHREIIDIFSRQGLVGIPIGVYESKNPKTPTVLYILGYAYLRQGSTDSLSYLLLNVESSGGKTFYQMSIVDTLPYSPMDMAGKNLKAALEAKPQFPDALAALGDCYLEVGQPELAVAKWEEAISLDDRFEPAYLSLARFYRSQKKYDKAVEEYQRSIALSPKSLVDRSATSRYAAQRHLELGTMYLDMEDLDMAEKELLRAKKQDSEMGMVYYKLGQVYAKRGERDEAVKMYRTGRKYDPNNAEVAYELALIFLDNGDTKYALLSMERGLSAEAVDDKLSQELMSYIDKGTIAAANFMSQLANFEYSDNFHLHYFLGKLYLKLGDNDDTALKHFKIAAGLSPSNADVRYQLGRLQEKLEPEKAREQYQAAAELGTTDAEPLFKVAQSYLEEGNEGKFIETAQQALSIDPSRAEVHLQLAEIFRKRADIYRNNGQKKQEDEAISQAVKHYEEAATLQPDAQKWYELGMLYERQPGIKAVRAYEKAIQLDPSFALAYYRLGRFRLSYKVGRVSVRVYQPEVAVEDFKKAIESDPKLADAYFWLGKAYYEMDMSEQATAEFERTMEIDPNHIEAHIYLAQDYAAAGEYQKVIQHLSKAAELDDTNGEVLKNLGAMLLKYGGDSEVKRAQKALEKALELMPDDAEVLMNYGYTLYLDRMFNSAIDELKKALEIRPDYPEANYNIALAYSGARKYDLARQHWEKVIELVPGTPLAEKAAEFVEKVKNSQKK